MLNKINKKIIIYYYKLIKPIIYFLLIFNIFYKNNIYFEIFLL